MLKIGCHLSISKGFYSAGLQAVAIGANTFQFFTRNPRGGNAKKIAFEDAQKLSQLIKEYDFGPLFAHAPYTMNLSSDKPNIREFAKNVFKNDLERLNHLPTSYYIFHPGSHVGQGREEGMHHIIDAINDIVLEDNKTTILLEGMSGKGTEIGKSLEELKYIIENIKYNENLGICIDTCHIHSAGYDIVNNLDGVLDEIEQVIGLERLKAVHLNDNKNEFASNKDRHAVIGEGKIGIEAIVKFINHPKLRNLPFNLETPNDLDGYKKEIELLRKNYK